MRHIVGLFCVLLGWVAGAQPPPPEPWTPETVMRQAASRLPSVEVAKALWKSAQAYAQSIGSQPNPYLRLSAVAGEPNEEVNALVFRFETAGQPGLREQSAQSSALARCQELRSEKRTVALRAGQAYFTYWEKLNILGVAQTRVDLAQSLERSSFRRLNVGEISQNSHRRAQLELARAQADWVTARVESEQAQGLLNLLMGRPVEQTISLAAQELFQPSCINTSLSDLQSGLSSLPDLEALRLETEAQESLTELARRGNAPDLQLQFYRDRLGPTQVQAAQLAITIPLWDWGTVAADVGRREGLAEAAKARQAERKLALEQRTLEAWKRYQGSLEREKILSQQASQFSRLSADARRAYDANLMTLLEVFDVQLSYRQALQTYISAQAEVARAALEIQALHPDGFFEEVSRVHP